MKARPAALMVKGNVHFVYPSQDIVAGDIVSKRSLWELVQQGEQLSVAPNAEKQQRGFHPQHPIQSTLPGTPRFGASS